MWYTISPTVEARSTGCSHVQGFPLAVGLSSLTAHDHHNAAVIVDGEIGL